MEHERSTKETPINFEFGKFSNEKYSDDESCQKIKVDEKQEGGSSFSSPTPEKPKLHIKQDYSDDLPENYQILAEFFSRLDTSIRLLGLRKLLPTFRNICAQVEVLTRRKFLYKHLAQMNYIFPEALQIDKILVHDKETLLVIPDMKVTLLKDVAGQNSQPGESVSISLSEAFRARLWKFLISHPEGTDVPEAMLPEPFNCRSHDLPPEMLAEICSMENQRISAQFEESLNASLLSSSFKRHFSRKLIIPETEQTHLLATKESPKTMCSCDEVKENMDSSLLVITPPASMTTIPNNCMVSQISGSTPVKGVSLHLSNRIAITPAQQTPKRPVPTPNEKFTENEGLDKEVRLTTSARRSLIYSPSNLDEIGKDTVGGTSHRFRFVKSSSDQTALTKRCLWEEETEGPIAHLPDMVHNRISASFKDDKLSQMEGRRLYEMLSSTFDAICLVSRSTNGLSITKEELIHKILSNNLEIEDTREVEEHLSLLESLLPDWICKKDSSNGQFLYSIKQASNPEAYRTRIVEAAERDFFIL